MRRQLVIGSLCLLSALWAHDAAGQYLSTRSRPAAGNTTTACLAHRRQIFDTGGTLFFTTADPLTSDQALALEAALAAWNSEPRSSVRVAYGGVSADNADRITAAPGNGEGCESDFTCDLATNDINSIKLNVPANELFCDPAATVSETMLADPGIFNDWIDHPYCDVPHWTIAGSRIRVRSSVTGAGLARVLAHEIGKALGFAPTNLAPNVLHPNIDLSAGSPPYTVALGEHDRDALVASYPVWQLQGPGSVCGESIENEVSVVNWQAGTTYEWVSLDDAVITSVEQPAGASPPRIRFTAPPFGGYIVCIVAPCIQQSVRFSVTAQKGCGGPGTAPAFLTRGEISIPVGPGDYRLVPYSATYDSPSATGSIAVEATQSCSGWSAKAPEGSFVTITSGASGSGSGTVQYAVAANPTSAARSTTLTIAGEPFEVTQAAAGFDYVTLISIANPSQVFLNWGSAPGAASFDVWRSSGGGAFTLINTLTNPAMTDFNVSNGTGYLYRIGVRNGAGTLIAYSGVDIAVPFAYTDAEIQPGVTPVRAAHLLQLRQVVNAGRFALGWSSATFNGTITAGGAVQRAHLVDLRSAVDAVRAGVGLPVLQYLDPNPTVGVTPIRADHISALRTALR